MYSAVPQRLSYAYSAFDLPHLPIRRACQSRECCLRKFVGKRTLVEPGLKTKCSSESRASALQCQYISFLRALRTTGVLSSTSTWKRGTPLRAMVTATAPVKPQKASEGTHLCCVSFYSSSVRDTYLNAYWALLRSATDNVQSVAEVRLERRLQETGAGGRTERRTRRRAEGRAGSKRGTESRHGESMYKRRSRHGRPRSFGRVTRRGPAGRAYASRRSYRARALWRSGRAYASRSCFRTKR